MLQTHVERPEIAQVSGLLHHAVQTVPVAIPVGCSSHAPLSRSGAEAPRSRTPLPSWRLRRVVAHIDAHLEDPVTLADLAGVAGLSRMHFAAQFRAATGLRPHEFLLRRRIDHARYLLADSRSKLVDVALSVGFQTQAHFTTVFKRIVGETPHRWRYAAGHDGAPGQPATFHAMPAFESRISRAN